MTKPLWYLLLSRDSKMDILNSDLQLKMEASSKKRSKGHDENDTDAGFHFIAFMPAMGQVWKFDGLERQPQALGQYLFKFLLQDNALISVGECSEEDWLELARPNIVERMAAYEEDQIEFSILGLVQDPLPELLQRLAVNVRSLEILHARLMSPEDQGPADMTLTELQETVLGPDPSYGLTRADIDAAIVSEIDPLESTLQLQQRQQGLRAAQRELRARIREEQQLRRADEDHATGRRYDYGPAVRTWLRFLARRQLLAELLQSK